VNAVTKAKCLSSHDQDQLFYAEIVSEKRTAEHLDVMAKALTKARAKVQTKVQNKPKDKSFIFLFILFRA
jgi:hypothetical protein